MTREELKQKLLENDRVRIRDFGNTWEVETWSNEIRVIFGDPFSITLESVTWDGETWRTTVSSNRDVLILFNIFGGK